MAPLVIIRSGTTCIEYKERIRLAATLSNNAYNNTTVTNNQAENDEQLSDIEIDNQQVNDDDHQRSFSYFSDEDEFLYDNDSEEEDMELIDAFERWDLLKAEHENISELSNKLQDYHWMRAFRCAECNNIVADHDDIVSKSFFGKSGKAFLMNSMFNIRTGIARSRHLMTGVHKIADTFCMGCDTILGWKYLVAMEAPQKYKEGKFVMETARVLDDLEEEEQQHQTSRW